MMPLIKGIMSLIYFLILSYSSFQAEIVAQVSGQYHYWFWSYDKFLTIISLSDS